MLFRDVINLVRVTEADDGMGGVIETETPVQVFANKKSIRQSEFYQAAASGLKPEIMFEVRSIEYGSEQKLQFNGKEHLIIRTYSKNDELTELICSGYTGVTV